MRMYVNTLNTRGCEPFCILPQAIVATITASQSGFNTESYQNQGSLLSLRSARGVRREHLQAGQTPGEAEQPQSGEGSRSKF